MAISHADFLRTLERGFGPSSFRVTGTEIAVVFDGREVRIRLGPENVRRIASLALPLTDVRFEFPGHDAAQAEAFLDYFDRRFQRGGG